ncbi:MAG: ATP-dependent DNA helicase RecG [Oscillibacter sp.]|nr:ATP-dependent DNA helicase RecG [Oscillibacter sp.]
MTDLFANLQTLRGIGVRRARAFQKMGITTVNDLLTWFPRRYEDRRAVKAIADLVDGESVCVRGFVAAPPVVTRVRDGLDLLQFPVTDHSGVMRVTFFNRLWIKNTLAPGTAYVFYGKAERNLFGSAMSNPVAERADRQEETGRIWPVYSLSAGVSRRMLCQGVRAALRECATTLPDVIPEEVRRSYGLCAAGFAYENIHFPENEAALADARRRLAFEELFLLAVGLRGFRGQREAHPVEAFRDVDMSPFYDALPFTLTDAQRRCIAEALSDMRSGVPMNRLCQGDVGSGKTMVAAACVYHCVRNGRQAALMAPTELLARQHYEGLSALLSPLGVRVALLTGSVSAKEKRAIRRRTGEQDLDFVIGTHALISDGVEFARLGLVVTDEQHRFGVAQRGALAAKGQYPHILVMSATPIPRTLALSVYGDLDVSFLDELPPGRRKIQTYAVSGDYRPRVYRFLEKQMAEGRQIYIVCPMVEEGAEASDDRKAVTEYAYELQNVFPNRRVLSVHGRMKPKDKEAVMSAFAAGDGEVLISTTVIEVGIDVPNASVMVVENAERFGLSQLHQLRGRVGRGKHQSYCILISDSRSEETRRRLRVMVTTSDGFRVAEEDLRLRGPGDFFGERQHGLPPLKIANLADSELLRQAQTAAAELSPERYPLTVRRAAELFSKSGTA